MHGSYTPSKPQRIIMVLLHGVWVICFMLYLHQQLGWGARTIVLSSMALLYFGRLVTTTFLLLQRSIKWNEAVIVSLWLGIIYTVFGYFGGQANSGLASADIGAILLYVTGSFVNSWAELQRHAFKKNPLNKGKIYTGGLFKAAIHVNYLGDSLLFVGFAWATLSAWSFLIPVVMTAGFIFQHIPAKEQYLAQKYGEDFEHYRNQTAHLVPFIY